MRFRVLVYVSERVSKMKNVAVLGASWGDEAKARICADWADQFDYVIRFAGGDNCGGQVLYGNGRSYIHHLLPAIDYSRNAHTKSFLASGMVINLPSLLEEITNLQKDFPDVGRRVIVDPDAFIVKPEHIERDKTEGQLQGTTFRGIRQSYTEKVDRCGTRVYNLINDNAEIIQALQTVGVQFISLLALRETMEKSNLLFEGNQGVMLGLNDGLYPYITSSDTGVSGIYSAGFHWVKNLKSYGVAKGGYITRSGGRKLPTEMPEEEAAAMVEKANERGNTTGRARGIGYFDIVALTYAIKRGGIDALVLTKLDIMNGQKNIKVCNSYGKEVFSPNDFENITPEYIELPGWDDASNQDQIMPFIDYVQTCVSVPVEYYSCGVGRDDLKKIEVAKKEAA